MKTKIKAIAMKASITSSAVTGILHPGKRMLYYRTNTGNKTVVPFLIASKLFLPTNLTLNNPTKDTSLLEFCFTLLIHICTICKNAVMFILNKIINVLTVMNSGSIKAIILDHTVSICGNVSLIAMLYPAMFFGIIGRWVFGAGKTILSSPASGSFYYGGIYAGAFFKNNTPRFEDFNGFIK